MGASVRPDTTRVSDPVSDYLTAKQAVQGSPGTQGASDPVSEYLNAKQAAHGSTAAPSTPEKPGVLSRAYDQLKGIASHPINAVESAVTAPVTSAVRSMSLGDQQAKDIANDPTYMAKANPRFGGRQFGMPPSGGVTGKERVAALAQTVGNIALPGIAGGIAGKTGSALFGAAGAGAVSGATYSPDDPVAGAMTGAVLGAGGRAIGGGVSAGAKSHALLSRIRDVEPIGETALEHTEQIDQAKATNYARTAGEAKEVGGTTPAIQDAFAHPRVKPFVDLYRGSDEGANASDAFVARKVDQLMTRQRRALEKKNALATEYDAKADIDVQNIKAGQRALRQAIAAPSQKPALSLDVAPETYSVDPEVTGAREAMEGPLRGGQRGQVLPGHETITGPIMEGTAGRARGNEAQVSIDPSGKATSVSPRDVQGPAGPAFMLRGQPPQGTPEIAGRPAFQLRANPGKITPGVEIRTPGMRVQTAPAEDVPAMMPSYGASVQELAQLHGAREAGNLSASQIQRVLGGTKVNPKKLDVQGGPAFRKQIQAMSPEEAEMGLNMGLGRANELTKIHFPTTHATAFGTAASVVRPYLQANKIAPYIEALDAKAGTKNPKLLAAIEQLRALTTPGASLQSLQRDDEP